MSSIIREAVETFVALAKGFSVTFRNMLRKTVTENYPEEPVHFQARYRGIHVLHRDETGLEKCVGCFLCAAAFCVLLLVRRAAFISRPRKTRTRSAFPLVSDTRAFTTSITRVVSSAAIA